jgi:hypothetical protein
MPTHVGALTPSHPLLQLLQQQQHEKDQQLPPTHQQDQQLPPPQQQDQQQPRALPPDVPAKIRSAANALPMDRVPSGGHGRRTPKHSEAPFSIDEEANRNQVLLLQQRDTDFSWGRYGDQAGQPVLRAGPQLGMLDDVEGNINLGHYLSDDMWANQGRAGASGAILSLWRS